MSALRKTSDASHCADEANAPIQINRPAGSMSALVAAWMNAEKELDRVCRLQDAAITEAEAAHSYKPPAGAQDRLWLEG